MSVMRKDFMRYIGPHGIRMVAVFDDRDIPNDLAASVRIHSGQEMFPDMAIMPTDTFERVFRSQKEPEAILDRVKKCQDAEVLRNLVKAAEARILELEGSESCTCCVCGFEQPWEASDDIHGSMWTCEECGETFCTKCFVDRHGSAAYHHMVREADKILCPNCYEKEKKEGKQ